MIFADTGFLFALFSKRDRHHARAVEVFKTFEDRRLPDEILTTDLAGKEIGVEFVTAVGEFG